MGIAIQQAPEQAEVRAQPATPVRRRGWEAVAVVLLLLVAAGARLPTLDQPLVETHAFRQTQTAYTALLFHENGVTYPAAISPAPAALAGVAFARAWRWAPTPRAQRLVLAGLGVSLPPLVVLNADYVALPYGNPGVEDAHPELAEVLRVTQLGDLVAFEGYDWDPSLPYYARRSGHMLGPERVTTAAELTAEGYRLLVSRRLESDRAVDLVRAGRWTGVLGARTYITGDSLAELRGAPLAATDGLAVAGPSLPQQPVTVACGESGVALPRPNGITVLRLAAGTPAGAKLAVAGGYGDIPVREYVVVDPSLPGPLVVDCRDAASVTIEAVTGRPPGTL